MTRPGSLHIVLLLLACLLVLGHGLVYWNGTIDDAYISFRYAANLAAGNGPVFNPGQRIEGYSNPLWTLLMALAILARLDPMLAAKLVGLASALVTVLALDRLLARAGSAWPGRLAGLALAALSVPLAFWSVQGLETTFFTMLLSLAFWRFPEELDRRRGFPWSALLFALACLTRPEGPLYLAVFLAVRLVHGGKGRRGDLYWLLACFLPLTAHLLWRRAFYGEWLPNTWFAKGTAGAGLSFESHAGGAAYIGSFLASGWGVPAILGLLGLAAAGAALLPGGRRADAGRIVLPLSWIAAAFFFAWQAGGDWMAHSRFLVPAVPALALLAAAGIDGGARGASAILRRIDRRGGDRALLLVSSALAGLLLAAVLAEAVGQGRGREIPHGKGGQYPRLLPMATGLMETLRDGETVVYGDIGIVGYLNPELRIIDNRGLVHRTMARMIFNRPNRMDEVRRLIGELQRECSAVRPEAVVLVINNTAKAPVWQTEVYALHPAFRRNYAEARRLSHRRRNSEVLFLRRDLVRRKLEPGEVADHYRRAVALAPRIGELYLGLARQCRRAGRQELRRRTLEQARRRFAADRAFIRRLEQEAGR